MNKPSERIVVFVTPAQKRAISATADELGISISELMRRAVIAFSATSDQVKAASIVDRLSATREPDALAQVLRKAAKPLRAGRAAGLRPAVGQFAPTDAQADAGAAMPPAAETGAPLPAESGENAATAPATGTGTDPADTANITEAGRAERELAQAVARLADEAAQATEVAATEAGAALPEDAEPLQPLGGASFARGPRDEEEDAHRNDPAPDTGKFA